MAIDWRKIFKAYKGKWVALKDDEKSVIAFGKTIKEVMEKSKKKGFDLPILFRVPTENIAYIGILDNEVSL